MLCRQNHGAYGDDLQHHFRLAERRGGNCETFSGSNVAETQNDDFTTDDNHRHPALHQMHFNERDKCRGHQQLVRYRVEQDTERRNFAAPPGIIAIRPIGGRGRQQDQHTPNGKINSHAKKNNIGSARQKDNDQHRNKEDP